MQDYMPFPNVRPSAILTGSYVSHATNGIIGNAGGRNQLILLIDFTKGNLASGELKLEFADNKAGSFFQEVAQTVSGGTATETLLEHTFTATGKYRIAIPLKDEWIKVSCKGTGADPTGSLMSVDAIIGIA